MKHPHSIIAIAIALACSAASTFAAETNDVSVNGTIRPAACNLSLSQTNFDLGTNLAASLSASTATNLGDQFFDVLITCDGPLRIGLVAADNRDGTAFKGPDVNNYGFGLLDDKPLGYYRMFPSAPLGDGLAAVNIVSTNQGETWQAQAADWWLDHDSKHRLAFAEPGRTIPKAFTTVLLPLKLSTQLPGKDSLPPLTDAIPLDGSATISLIYF